MKNNKVVQYLKEKFLGKQLNFGVKCAEVTDVLFLGGKYIIQVTIIAKRIVKHKNEYPALEESLRRLQPYTGRAIEIRYRLN